jgi:hypothetical protein
MTTTFEIELLSPSDLKERDIDLLRREELYVSGTFQRFFFSVSNERRFLNSTRASGARHSGCGEAVDVVPDESNQG